MSASAAGVGRAVVIGLAVVRAAEGSRRSWDGWDLAAAKVQASPENEAE